MKEINLKKVRKKYNLTQEDVAVILGVTTKTVSNWERGVTNMRPVFAKYLIERLE